MKSRMTILMLGIAATCACSGGSSGSEDPTDDSPAGTPTPTPTPPPPTSPPSTDSPIPAGYTVVSARNFGVTCDGVMDDTLALQSALNGLKSYQALELPAGTCLASDNLRLYQKDQVAVVGAGSNSTVIKVSDPAKSSFVVSNSSNVTLRGFEVYSPNSTTRMSDAASRGIYVEKSSNITLDAVRARKTAGAGIVFWVVNGGLINNSEVIGSLADAFHITGSSSNITLQFNRATGSGDDCFASIGYGTSINTNIKFLDGYCADNMASGISFEGTNGGGAARNTLVRTGVAGIRIASVGSYNTGPVDNILLEDNVLDQVRTRTEVAHAAIMLFVQTPGTHVRNISLVRTKIVNPLTGTGFRAFGKSATENVTASLVDTQFVGVTTAIKVESYATVTGTGNTLNGSPVN